MEAMNAESRLRVFKATDAFAVDAYAATRNFKRGRRSGLASEIRRTAIASGGAIVAASASEPGGEQELGHMRRARSALIEGRYYLYLARRFGMLEQKLYRVLASRQDTALRELEGLLRPTR